MFSIPLMKPFVAPDTRDRLGAVLDSGWLTEGPVTREFEKGLSEAIGAGHALAVPSCTLGLELALRALGVGPGDEVVVPDYTYPATADVVRIVGATLVLVDVDPFTWLVDIKRLEEAMSPRTKAVMPVSLFGNPLDHEEIRALADRRGVRVIEDAACALGARWGAAWSGSRADIGVFSFHPRKSITTGEGGLVVTSDPTWAEWMRSYQHFGLQEGASREGASFVRIGTNMKMSNLAAAVGLAQVPYLDELLATRRTLAARYNELLGAMPGIRLPSVTPGGTHAWQTYAVLVESRDDVMRRMRAAGIEAQIGTYCLHRQAAFAEGAGVRYAGTLDVSAAVADHALALPMYHDMTFAEQDEVARALSCAVVG